MGQQCCGNVTNNEKTNTIESGASTSTNSKKKKQEKNINGSNLINDSLSSSSDFNILYKLNERKSLLENKDVLMEYLELNPTIAQKIIDGSQEDVLQRMWSKQEIIEIQQLATDIQQGKILSKLPSKEQPISDIIEEKENDDTQIQQTSKNEKGGEGEIIRIKSGLNANGNGTNTHNNKSNGAEVNTQSNSNKKEEKQINGILSNGNGNDENGNGNGNGVPQSKLKKSSSKQVQDINDNKQGERKKVEIKEDQGTQQKKQKKGKAPGFTEKDIDDAMKQKVVNKGGTEYEHSIKSNASKAGQGILKKYDTMTECGSQIHKPKKKHVIFADKDYGKGSKKKSKRH